MFVCRYSYTVRGKILEGWNFGECMLTKIMAVINLLCSIYIQSNFWLGKILANWLSLAIFYLSNISLHMVYSYSWTLNSSKTRLEPIIMPLSSVLKLNLLCWKSCSMVMWNLIGFMKVLGFLIFAYIVRYNTFTLCILFSQIHCFYQCIYHII